jgi:hypothetical protein
VNDQQMHEDFIITDRNGNLAGNWGICFRKYRVFPIVVTNSITQEFSMGIGDEHESCQLFPDEIIREIDRK